MGKKTVIGVVNQVLSFSGLPKYSAIKAIFDIVVNLDEDKIGKLDLKDESEMHAFNLIVDFLSDEELNVLKEDYRLTYSTLFSIMRKTSIGVPLQTIKEPVSKIMERYLSFDIEKIYMPFGGDVDITKRRWGASIDVEIPINEPLLFLNVLANCAYEDDRENVLIYHSNPLETVKTNTNRYERIYLPYMPYGMHEFGRKYIEDFVLNLFDLLVDNGKMVVLLPSSFLWGDNYFELRKYCAENKYLRQIISLSNYSALTDTNINTCIAVFEKRTGENGFELITPSTDQIISDVLLNNIKYLDGIPYKWINYSEMWKDKSLRIMDYSFISEKVPDGFKYVRLSDILTRVGHSCNITNEERGLHLTGKTFSEKEGNLMINSTDAPYDILKGRYIRIDTPSLCFHSISCKVLGVLSDTDSPFYINSDIYSYEVKDHRIPLEYISYALSRPESSDIIQNMRFGLTIPRVSRADFLSVKILIPDTDNDVKFDKAILAFLKKNLEEKIKKEKEASEESLEGFKEMIEDKVHLAGPYNASLQTSLIFLQQLLKEGVSISSETIMYDGMTALELIESALKSSVNYGKIVSKMALSIFGSSQIINLSSSVLRFIADVKKDLLYKDIKIEFEAPVKEYDVLFYEEALHYALTTIFRNAIRHGFTNLSIDKRILITVDDDKEGDFVKLSIANNGNNVAPDFSLELYKKKGGKCGPYANTGRGGKLIADVMKYYKGRLNIVTTNEEWPFIVELYIPVDHE